MGINTMQEYHISSDLNGEFRMELLTVRSELYKLK